jgi:hypothetical protein
MARSAKELRETADALSRNAIALREASDAARVRGAILKNIISYPSVMAEQDDTQVAVVHAGCRDSLLATRGVSLGVSDGAIRPDVNLVP